MLDTKETAQIQMHLLYKKGALLEWEETWWEDKNKDTEKSGPCIIQTCPIR